MATLVKVFRTASRKALKTIATRSYAEGFSAMASTRLMHTAGNYKGIQWHSTILSKKVN